MAGKRSRPGIDDVPLFDVFSEVDAKEHARQRKEHRRTVDARGIDPWDSPLLLTKEEIDDLDFDAQFKEVNRKLLTAINVSQDAGELATLANSFFRGHKVRQDLASGVDELPADVKEYLQAFYGAQDDAAPSEASPADADA